MFVSITVLAYVPFQGNYSLTEADVLESCKQHGIQSFMELVANCINQEKCMSEKKKKNSVRQREYFKHTVYNHSIRHAITLILETKNL